MIKFNFANLKDQGKAEGFGFGDAQKIAVDGMNIAGYCSQVNEEKAKCGAYIVLPIGFINKTNSTTLHDIKKLAC